MFKYTAYNIFNPLQDTQYTWTRKYSRKSSFSGYTTSGLAAFNTPYIFVMISSMIGLSIVGPQLERKEVEKREKREENKSYEDFASANLQDINSELEKVGSLSELVI